MLFAAGTCAVSAQNIRGRYVAKAEADGTIYHTLPCTLFEHAELGDLVFDITYKERHDGMATLNFTCLREDAAAIDSVCFDAGRTQLRGAVERLYIEPEKRRWKHRYSLRTPVASLCTFFDEEALPTVTLYGGGRTTLYRAKRSAWRSYAPIGYKIFETVRVNETP